MAKIENVPQETEMQEVPSTDTASTPTASKRDRKLNKEIDFGSGIISIEVVGGVKGKMDFEFGKLPDAIKANLGPFGLGHKLGDAASGKSGEDAEEAIVKVFEGLVNGDWSVRAPATPKLTKNEISERLSKLDPDARAAAIAGLAALGIEIKI